MYVPVSDVDGPFWHYADESREKCIQRLRSDVNAGLCMIRPVGNIRAIEFHPSKVRNALRKYTIEREGG